MLTSHQGRWIGSISATSVALTIAAASPSRGTDAAPSDNAPMTYADNCAACHGLNLEGGGGPNGGPALRGEAFAAKWRNRAPAELLGYISTTMPLNLPGSLDAASYASIDGYIRAANHLPAVTQAGGADKAPAATTEVGVAVQLGPDDGKDSFFRAALDRRAALAAWIAPVGDASILHPDDGDWLAWRRTPDALGYSPLKQIDVSNAGNLAMTWSLSLAPGTNGMVPLVRNGVMFLHASGLVQALDATSGDMLWSYSRPAKSSRTAATQPRGLALYGDTLYVPTIDGHLIALDARTGALRWDHEIVKPKQRLILTATPLAVRGKIIQGVSGCQDATNGGGCFIVALDAATGEEAWRFYSIAEPGQPGGDSWNGAPWSERYGGSVWTTGSYDADLNLVYFGIGQTYVVSTLLKPGSAGERSRDALYTNSTVALDPDSGRLVWHYQHAPGDVWDQDWAFEQTLTTVQTGRGPRKALITSGKEAIIDAVDARTGAYLWSKDLGLQNLIVDINPKTGRKRYDPALTPEQGKFKHVCPSAVGFRNWPATAVDPASGLMFMPITRSCMDIALTDSANPSSWAFGELTIVRRVPPNSDGNYGRLVAVDMNSRQIRWTNDRRAPQSSAVLATGGGLVFEGGRDRYFRALESATGKTVWQVRLDNAPNGFPITYMADGVQYVAIVTGGGTVVDSYFAPYTPEFPPSNGSRSVAVFALPSANRSASR